MTRQSPLLVLIRVFLLEIIREKWFVGLVLVAVALFLMSLSMGSLSFDEHERILFHLSIATIHVLGLGICLILGVAVMAKEVERQTCLLMLARPLSRGQFLLAKAAALALFLAIFDFGLGIFLGILLGGEFSWPHLLSILLNTWLEHVILLTFALWAGLFLGRSVAGLFTIGVFIIGHWLPDLDFFAKKSQSEAFMALSKAVNVVTPHLYELNQRSFDILKSGISDHQMIWNGMHAIGWIIVLYFLAFWIWRKKDLV